MKEFEPLIYRAIAFYAIAAAMYCMMKDGGVGFFLAMLLCLVASLCLEEPHVR